MLCSALSRCLLARHLDNNLTGLARQENIMGLLPLVQSELVGHDHGGVNLGDIKLFRRTHIYLNYLHIYDKTKREMESFIV